MQNLYVIAGCNGAGKTTSSYTILPEMLNCQTFINADEIAKGLSPFQPDKAAIKAGRIMLDSIKDLIHKNHDFAFETTLATKSYAGLISKAQKQGYFVVMVFFWLNSVELAIERVNLRVKEGGHNIDKETIIRRYYSGLRNFFKIYSGLVDYWLFIDNSYPPFELVAEYNKEIKTEVFNNRKWENIKSLAYG